MLTADGAVLHLDEHLGGAVVSGSEVPVDVVRSVDWDADDLLADLRAIGSEGRDRWLAEEPGIVSAGGGALRLTADARHSNDRGAYSVLVTPQGSGRLGPWSGLVSALGVDPRSEIMKATFVTYGVCSLVVALGFLTKVSWGWWGMVIVAALGLWYLPFGTVLGSVSLVLLFLPQIRKPWTQADSPDGEAPNMH